MLGVEFNGNTFGIAERKASSFVVEQKREMLQAMAASTSVSTGRRRANEYPFYSLL